MIYEHMFPWLDLYSAGPAQLLTAAGEELDDLRNGLYDLNHDLSGCVAARARTIYGGNTSY